MKTTHKARQESRIERIKHKRMQNFIFGYVTEKNRNEVIARFRFDPKSGEEHFVSTGLIRQSGSTQTIQLYKLQKQFTRYVQNIIFNDGAIDIDQMVAAFTSYLPQNENHENSTGE